MVSHKGTLATTVLLDDFQLRELPDEPMETETRTGSIALDADFSAQKPGGLSPPWYFANLGGQGIRGESVSLPAQPSLFPIRAPALLSVL